MSTIFPWRVTDSGVRDDAGYICLIPKPTHYPGQDERYKNEVAERQANAILISAARELLAACRKAVCAVAFAAEHDSIYQAIYDELDIAIAKATGAQS